MHCTLPFKSVGSERFFFYIILKKSLIVTKATFILSLNIEKNYYKFKMFFKPVMTTVIFHYFSFLLSMLKTDITEKKFFFNIL